VREGPTHSCASRIAFLGQWRPWALKEHNYSLCQHERTISFDSGMKAVEDSTYFYALTGISDSLNKGQPRGHKFREDKHIVGASAMTQQFQQQ
jgi:hypothetical protein